MSETETETVPQKKNPYGDNKKKTVVGKQINSGKQNFDSADWAMKLQGMNKEGGEQPKPKSHVNRLMNDK